jgi:hypothetical protein
MECRKARYCLVASFDAPLDPATHKELSYHLKDCRKCRHEAFYYRELFAAEKQLDVLTPSDDFNDRLLAAIRLREARASWPQPESHPVRVRRRRWQLVFLPTVFAAAAVMSFFMFLPDQPAERLGTQVVATPAATAPAQQAPTTQLAQPRYVYGQARSTIPVHPRMAFRLHTPSSAEPGWEDPFATLLISSTLPVRDYRVRERTRYVLPVVSQTSSRDRIY